MRLSDAVLILTYSLFVAFVVGCAAGLIDPPLSNRAPIVHRDIKPPNVRLACAWHFDWLGVVQLGGGVCR